MNRICDSREIVVIAKRIANRPPLVVCKQIKFESLSTHHYECFLTKINLHHFVIAKRGECESDTKSSSLQGA